MTKESTTGHEGVMSQAFSTASVSEGGFGESEGLVRVRVSESKNLVRVW